MPRRRFRPAVEALEARDVPATFTVTTAADAGPGSLRAAITSANAAAGLDTIAFAIPATGVQTINLLSALPNVTGSTVIDGYTQPGSSPNTLAVGSDAVVLIELNGAGVGAANGLVLTGATTSTVRGLAINRFQGSGGVFGGNGIYIPLGNGHVVAGNVIGMDPTGAVARPNAIAGVEVQNGISDIVVGGASPADRNVISGNTRAAVQTSGGSQRTRVEGNYLGTDATGTLDRGNGWYGVLFSGGGTGVVAGNVISGNTLQGVLFQDGSTGNTIRDNVIGLTANGTADLGNSQSGVRIQSSSNTLISGNVISGNDQHGVEIDGVAATTTGNVIRGNTIGLDIGGTIDLGNTLDGITLLNASGNTVGGPGATDRNVIAGNNGNGFFSYVGASGQTATNTIEGNFVGTDKTGTLDRGNGLKGVYFLSGVNGTIRGNLVSGNDGGGIAVGNTGGGGGGTTGNVIAGNTVGLDATGTAALGNVGAGVFVVGGNRVGGTAAADRNLISANTSHGVHIATSGDVGGSLIQGNVIGTDAGGTIDLGNGGHGVIIDRSVNNTASGNLISGNGGDGVFLFNSTGAVGNNVVRGNRIGVDAAGTAKLGNTGYGVRNIGQSANTIGGTAAGAGNVIGGNGQGGVLVSATHFATSVLVQGNAIGTDAAGALDLGNTGHGVWVSDANGNTIRENAIAFNTASGVRVETTSTIVGQLSGVNNLITRNAISANGGPGIDLVPTAGVTGNDAGDADTGANQRQNFPLLAPGVSDYVTTTLTGTLNSKASTTYTLEFFASGAADPSGFGEGGRFLGTVTVTTNAAGNATIGLILPAGVGVGEVVTATATDPTGNTSEFSAAVVVNHPPTASAGGPYTVPENGTVALDAYATFDPEQTAASLTYAWDLDGDGVFGETGETGVSPTFSAAGLDGNGAVPITVFLRVTDAGGLIGTATAAVTVANAAPTIAAVTATGPIEAGNTATVSVSASDPAGALDPLQYEFDFDGDGTFEVGPQAGVSALRFFNAAGSYTVGVRVTDGDGGSATGSVVVTVTNAAPVAVGVSVTLAEDTPTALTLNATDHENDALTFEIVSAPAHGTLSGSGANRTFTPAANYNGPDSFTFHVFDGHTYSNTATVSLTITPVNDAPVADASPDGAGVQLRDVSFHGTATDVEGQSLVYSWHFGDGGTSAGPDAVHQYATPGTYTATLTVLDSQGGVGTDTRIVTVRALNPTAGNDTANTNEDASVAVAVLANDTNPAGPSDPLVITGVTQGTFGSVTVNADGTLTYTPAANANGTDTFTYTVRNGDSGTATATVTVTVAAVNDAPTASGDSYSVNEDTTLTVPAPGVLANDADIDADALSVTMASGPAHGTLTLNPNGSFAYTPAANYHGTDSFTYTLSDGHGGTATGTVNITVNSVNDAPVAANNSYTATGGTTLTVAAPGVLQNDTDADGDALAAVLVSGPTHGTLTLNPNGSFAYTPTAGFTGTDAFTYRASDGTANSSLVTVSISVTGGGTGATLVPDPCDSTKTALVVRGTAGNDTITITPSGNSGAVVVKLNGTTLGTFNPTGRVIVFGQVGNDDIQTAGAVRRPVWLHGGAGNDRLKGGDGDDVLLGEDGNDLLTGAGGRDLLIGGEGADRIIGNDQDDILIAGFTQFDANDHALCAIMNEWTSCRNYAVRVLNLWSGLHCVPRENGNVFLNTTTVHDDGMEDVLTGSAGNDWFLFNADGDGGFRDRVTDMNLVEWLFAADIDFIFVDPT